MNTLFYSGKGHDLLYKLILLLPVILLHSFVIHAQSFDKEREAAIRRAREHLSQDIQTFNNYPDRHESDGPYNSSNVESLLQKNIPYFLCSNKDFTEVFNYRWWMISKHLRRWLDPEENKEYWVVTEFFGWPAHGSVSGAIPCPAGHQFYDMRWFRDPSYLESYITFYMKGYASRHNQRGGNNLHTFIDRPESHHFSSWMIDGTKAFLSVHPDDPWRDDLLPYLEKHQQVWDDKFQVHQGGAKTDSLYKVLDLYDGMEFTISATLPLIQSEGPYAIYTSDSWRKYYLGWDTIENMRKSEYVKKYPTAFAKGYPQLYLVRPSVNSYYFGNLRALGELYGQKAAETGLETDKAKSAYYLNQAEKLREKALSTLWNREDRFFYSITAADNAFGVKDRVSRVRESVGYTPWYFNMIPKSDTTYNSAWEMFSSPDGFYGNKGMTTAEKQHPLYNEDAYAWNGRGWPFQNSVVFKAYANYLRNYKDSVTPADKALLYDYISELVAMHGTERNIGEWYLPSDGQTFGGVKDYFHSTFPDMIISDLLGFLPSAEEEFSLQPLLPEDQWDYFFLGNLRYHEHDIDIYWKKDWDQNRDGLQSGLKVWVDGRLKVESESLNKKVYIELGAGNK